MDQFNQYRTELSVKAKNGINFILAASFIWLLISAVWYQDFSFYNKSIFTFYISALFMPLTWVLGKLLKTAWIIKDNPLDALGLWLNFAQLFYFPFLFFILSEMPEYFIMTMVIITGGHFFPYSWFYNTPIFAWVAGISSAGAYILGTLLQPEDFYWIPLCFTILLLIMAALLHQDYLKKASQPKAEYASK